MNSSQDQIDADDEDEDEDDNDDIDDETLKMTYFWQESGSFSKNLP